MYCYKQKEGMGMLVKTRWNKETQILLLSGRFDKTARVPVETALADGDGHPRNQVVLDFSSVSSMDSAGIGKVLLLYHSLRKKGVDPSLKISPRDPPMLPLITLFRKVADAEDDASIPAPKCAALPLKKHESSVTWPSWNP